MRTSSAIHFLEENYKAITLKITVAFATSKTFTWRDILK